MKQIKSSVLLISTILSLGLNASQMCMTKGIQSSTMIQPRVAALTRAQMIRGIQIPEAAILRTNDTGNCSLHYGINGFKVKEGSKCHAIESYDLDPELRQLNCTTMAKYLSVGKIKLSRGNDGSFMCRSHIDGKGGGVLGFWGGFFTGKFVTHFVCHGAILLAGACTGPAAPATIAALEATFFLPIGVAANTVGATTGMALAVATGPV